MRITTRLIIHCILPMDGIDGEGRIERMSPKGIKKKPSKSFNQDFPTAFYYNYQRVISIIVTSIIYIKIVGKCNCIYSMIQCLMHEHTTHAQSILCFDIMYLQVCSFYYVASLLYINYIAKLRILLIINYRRFFPLSYFVRQKFSNILNTTQIQKRGIFLSFPCLIE